MTADGEIDELRHALHREANDNAAADGDLEWLLCGRGKVEGGSGREVWGEGRGHDRLPIWARDQFHLEDEQEHASCLYCVGLREGATALIREQGEMPGRRSTRPAGLPGMLGCAGLRGSALLRREVG